MTIYVAGTSAPLSAVFLLTLFSPIQFQSAKTDEKVQQELNVNNIRKYQISLYKD
jgi:hypothetical protein